MRAPLAPPRLSQPRKVEAEAQAVVTSCGDGQAGVEDLRLQRGDVGASTSGLVVARAPGPARSASPPAPPGRGSADRAHVAVGQLEPGAGEGVGELLGVLEEARARSARRPGRPAAPGRWSSIVGGAALAVERVGHGVRAGAVLRASTGGRRRGSWSAPTRSRRGSRRSCCPVRRRGGPDDLEAAGDRVAALAGAVARSSSPGPAPRAGRPRARGRRCSGSAAPWVLPKVWPPAISATVSSSFIAIRAKVSRMSRADGERVGIAVGAFRVDVDQAHLHGGERVLELAVAGVARRRRASRPRGPSRRPRRAPRRRRGRRRSRRS